MRQLYAVLQGLSRGRDQQGGGQMVPALHARFRLRDSSDPAGAMPRFLLPVADRTHHESGLEAGTVENGGDDLSAQWLYVCAGRPQRAVGLAQGAVLPATASMG